MDPRIQAHTQVLKFEIDILRKYRIELSKLLTASLNELKTYVDSQAADMPQDQRDELYSSHMDRHWELSEQFPRLLNNSLFLTIFACLESEMRWISQYLQHIMPCPISISDLRGNGISKYATYLKKVHGVVKIDTTADWERLLLLRNVRNYLVHSNGVLDKSKNADGIREYARKSENALVLDAFDTIEVGEECNKDFIELVWRYVSEILDQVKGLSASSFRNLIDKRR